MKGSKLVSDYLTDQKRSLLDKRRQLVITDAQDRILWLIGERPDDRFRITVATTEILQLSI
jgi:tRNA(Ile)-lysidine synthase